MSLRHAVHVDGTLDAIDPYAKPRDFLGALGINATRLEKLDDITDAIGGDVSVDNQAITVAVWSAGTRALTSNGILPQIVLAGEEIGGETLNRVARSARNLVSTVPGILAGAHVTKAYLMVKNDLTDTDEVALLTKTITSSLSTAGQITDDATLTQAAVLDFALDNDDLDRLPLDVVLQSSIKLIMSTGAAYTPPALFRPVASGPRVCRPLASDHVGCECHPEKQNLA